MEERTSYTSDISFRALKSLAFAKPCIEESSDDMPAMRAKRITGTGGYDSGEVDPGNIKWICQIRHRAGRRLWRYSCALMNLAALADCVAYIPRQSVSMGLGMRYMLEGWLICTNDSTKPLASMHDNIHRYNILSPDKAASPSDDAFVYARIE